MFVSSNKSITILRKTKFFFLKNFRLTFYSVLDSKVTGTDRKFRFTPPESISVMVAQDVIDLFDNLARSHS